MKKESHTFTWPHKAMLEVMPNVNRMILTAHGNTASELEEKMVELNKSGKYPNEINIKNEFCTVFIVYCVFKDWDKGLIRFCQILNKVLGIKARKVVRTQLSLKEKERYECALS
jgi:hypothetical protein